MPANPAHGKIDEIKIKGQTVTLSGPLFWNGDDGRVAADAVTIVAAWAGQSGAEVLVASAFVDRQLTDHAVTEWSVDLETGSGAWGPKDQMAASVIALTTLADQTWQVWRETWDWAGMKR